MKKTQYGLRLKSNGEILKAEIVSNEGREFCVNNSVVLTENGNEVWLVDSRENAEWVRHNPTPWYNANYNTPLHYYEPEELEVVQYTVEITVEPVSVSLPPKREVLEAMGRHYKSKKEYQRMIEQMSPEEREGFHYELYSLELVVGYIPRREV